MGLTRGSVFPSKYLGKEDVAQPIRAMIGSIYMEQIQGDHGMENKAVLAFSDAGIKNMIVNSTNWDALAAAYGEDADGWLGKPVEVYTDPGVMFGGRRVGGVRVRIPAGAQAPAAPPLNAPMTPVGLSGYAQAVTTCEMAGISVAEMRAGLKLAGHTSWSQACEATILAMIQARQPAAFDADVPPPDDVIPF